MATSLAALTLIVSLAVAHAVNGALLSTVRVIDLGHWGEAQYSTFGPEDFWRALTAQLVHVKWPHMLYNVVCLQLTGALIERHVGAIGVFLIWAVIGGAATVLSPAFIPPPYDIGTGASQAVLAFVGVGFCLLIAEDLRSLAAFAIIAVSLVPALALDLVYAGFPKVGHLAAIAGGLLVGFLIVRRKGVG